MVIGLIVIVHGQTHRTQSTKRHQAHSQHAKSAGGIRPIEQIPQQTSVRAHNLKHQTQDGQSQGQHRV